MEDPEPGVVVCRARVRLVASLAPFVDKAMKRHQSTSWLDQVRNSRQPDSTPSAFDEAADVRGLDDQALLKVMLWYWSPVFSKCGLGKEGKGLVSQTLAARNRSAHPTSVPMSRVEASSYLGSIEQLLVSIGDNSTSREVQTLRDGLGRVDERSPEAREARDTLDQLEARLLEQISKEFRARAEATRHAGEQVLMHLQDSKSGVDRILQEMYELKQMVGGLLKAEPRQVPSQDRRVKAEHPSAARPASSLTWAVRKNPGESFSAWAVTEDAAPRYRLCFARETMARFAGPEVVDEASRRKGKWVEVEAPEAIGRLVKEARTRLGEPDSAG